MRDVVRRGAAPVPEHEARVLAGACVAATVVLLFCLAVPFSPTAPLRLTAALVVVSSVLATGLFAARRRLPVAVVHGFVALAVTLVSVCVGTSTTAVGAAVSAFGFVWLAMFVRGSTPAPPCACTPRRSEPVCSPASGRTTLPRSGRPGSS